MANLPARTTSGKVKKRPIDEVYEHKPEGGGYIQGQKKAPRAKQIQMWANEKDISLELLDSGKDDKEAWATVRATNTKTGQFVDSRVILIYKQLQDKMMIELAENPYKQDSKGNSKVWMFEDPKEPLLIDEKGNIVANLNTKGMIHVKKQMINKIYTAERTAETMAAARAESKILNKEWTDEDGLTDEEILKRMKEEEEQKAIEAPKNKEDKPKQQNKVRTFDKQIKTQVDKEKEQEEVKEPINEEKEQETEVKEEPKEKEPEGEKKDDKKGVSAEREPIKRVTRNKQAKIDTELFPPTRAKEEYKEVPGKEIVSMIRTDLTEAEIEPEMKNISVMLKMLKNEKKITPHQFRVANNYNLDMAF